MADRAHLRVIQGDGQPKPKPVNGSCVELLQETLDDAKKGIVEGVIMFALVDGEVYTFTSDLDEEYDAAFLYATEHLKYDLLGLED